MKLTQIDLIVDDVIGAATTLSTLLAVEPDEIGDRFAQVTAAGMVFMLSPDALVEMTPASGVILHIEVPSDFDATARAHTAGATVLRPTAPTDWGTVSTLVAGPGAIVIDFFSPAA